MSATAHSNVQDLNVLLRGEPVELRDWLAGWTPRRLALCLGPILVGTGLYGAAMGWWRDPVQGLFVAAKFPSVILLTTLGNALLNAMLAPLLGINISLRQSLLVMLMSFTIASAILGSFSPLVAFMFWNAPPMSQGIRSSGAYTVIQLTHVAGIPFARIFANPPPPS